MAIKNYDLEAQKAASLDFDALSERELLAMKNEIDTRLALGKLKDVDIGDEIVLQLRTVKLLQREAAADNEAPHGQKAQMATAVQKLLQDLTKMRTDLHNSERFKSMENALVQAFKMCTDNEVKDAFFSMYEEIILQFDTGLNPLWEEPAPGYAPSEPYDE